MKGIIKTLLILLMAQGSSTLYGESYCSGFGPQTPRDISLPEGNNPVRFNLAPHAEQLNLCNIHFHKNAEHKGPGFSISAGNSLHGGFQCNNTKSLTKAQLQDVPTKACGNIKPGDTVEIHWVHSSCDVKPGKGLGACLSNKCANPQLRVETQVFLLVNDPSATKMSTFDTGLKVNGFHQAKKLPTTATAVQYAGSTTGPKYDDDSCSSLQVSWRVAPNCQTMSIQSLHRWCRSNDFDERAAQGIRPLVTNKGMLSRISKELSH